MKLRLIALAAAVLLAACTDKPRGPLEVQNKIFMDSLNPVKWEFTGRDSGRVTNLERDVSTEFSYTLEDKKLIVRVPGAKGAQDDVVELDLRGDNYRGDSVDLAEFGPGDEKRVARIKEDARESAELAKRLSPKGSPSDAQAYRSVDELGDDSNEWAAWVAIARSKKPREDDQLLGLFSPSWNNTKDSFERQALRAGELDRIKKRLAEVRQVEYIKTPSGSQQISIFKASVNKPFNGGDAYDFSQKSFHLLGSACSSSNSVYKTNSGVTLKLIEDKAFCWLPVPDETVARSIESARTDKGLDVHNTVFAKIAGVDSSNEITLVPVATNYLVYTNTHREPLPENLLAEVSHWPYK